MNHKNTQSQPSANLSNLEAFHGLTEICLSSAERLTALNLASTREMLDDTLAASRHRPPKGNDSAFNLTQFAFVQPNLEKAIAYSRSAYEILLESQQEFIQSLSSQLTSMNTNFKVPGDWSAPFDMFTKGMQEVSSLTKKNASATTEAAQSAIAETLSKLAKVA
jgi:phasin family protein